MLILYYQEFRLPLCFINSFTKHYGTIQAESDSEQSI